MTPPFAIDNPPAPPPLPFVPLGQAFVLSERLGFKADAFFQRQPISEIFSACSIDLLDCW